jgi:hypothetical protein
VQALGYLRPPWALAFDNLFTMGWQEDERQATAETADSRLSLQDN